MRKKMQKKLVTLLVVAGFAEIAMFMAEGAILGSLLSSELVLAFACISFIISVGAIMIALKTIFNEL